jgi:hypothetical protein
MTAAVAMPDDEGNGPDVWNSDGTFSSHKAELIFEKIKRDKWPEEQKIAMLRWLRSAARREQIKTRYPNAAALAASVDPDFVVTPAIKLISDEIEAGPLNNARHNLIITMPPQEGKSTLAAVWTPIRALQRNPNLRIILAAYGDTLAEEHSSKIRTIIDSHGTDVVDSITGAVVEDKIGLKLSSTANRVSSWGIDGGIGGLKAVGIGSAITGRAADLFIIDDPFKNMMEADSPAHRKKINEWMNTVAKTRLSPQASMILIQTRWHPEDLAGKIIEGERALPAHFRTWKLINIPAIAEDNTEATKQGRPIIIDALNRPPGEAMVSSRGRTKEEFEATRRSVGDRHFYAMYQGSPTNPAGGLFARAWFEPRLVAVPPMPVAAVVGVDPADSGEGDEVGIIGGYLAQDGTRILAEDWSAQMSSDAWGTQAVMLALTMGAREIAMEAYAAANAYVNVIKSAWRAIHADAIEKAAAGAVLTPVEQRACSADMPFTIYKWRTPGDPVGRASQLRQALETKRARTIEYKMSVFESQAADWQAGQHCPDRVSAAIITDHRLAALGSGQMSLAAPVTQRPADAPAWMKRRITDAPMGDSFLRRSFARH